MRCESGEKMNEEFKIKKNLIDLRARTRCRLHINDSSVKARKCMSVFHLRYNENPERMITKVTLH